MNGMPTNGENFGKTKTSNVQIVKAEPQLLKSFNNNFTENNILKLMIETGLDFDDVYSWYQKMLLRIHRFYNDCPNPTDETLVFGVVLKFESWNFEELVRIYTVHKSKRDEK